MIVLGADPGLANLGWCVVGLYDEPVRGPGLFPKPAAEQLLQWGHIHTPAKKKGSNGKVSDHNLDRIRKIALPLLSVANHWGERGNPLVAICAEAQSWPHVPILDPFARNVEAAAKQLEGQTRGAFASSTKLAMSWGVLGTLSVLLDVPVIQVSPQTMRKRLLGVGKGDKIAIEQAICDRYGEAWLGDVLAVPKTNREHVTDSIGAVIACLDEPAIRRLRGGSVLRTPMDLSDIDFG